MPAVITTKMPNSVGNERMVRGVVTFDNSYPTGGESITPAQFGLSSISDVLCVSSAQGVYCHYNAATAKVMAFHSNDPGVSIGPLVEVANATDLSTVSVTVLAFGN